MAHFFRTVCLLGVVQHAGAATLRNVDVLGTDAGDCASDPCFSLSYAIAQAVTGDVVELGPGTHSGPLNRNLELGGKAALTIRGVAGTIVDLQNEGRFMKLDLSAGATRIQGLTILNGNCVKLADGSRKGAGFMLVNSTAILTNLTLRFMTCNSEGTVYGAFCEWCGGAFYMEDSSALLSNLLVTDCIANHGSGIATWANESSVIEDSVFERHEGTKWGGTLLAEGNSRQEFRRVRFSWGTSGAGGHLDDGGTSAPTFTDCIFEYGRGLQGSIYYSYSATRVKFENCVFQHSYATKSAAAYITGGTLPSFINVTFYNNTARIEAGAVRAFTVGKNGPLVFKNSRFIQNSVESAGAFAGGLEVSGNAIFDGCLFEDNYGGLSGGAIVNSGAYGAGLPLVIKNTVFKGNKADAGSAIFMWTINQESDKVPLVSIIDCVFEGNYATYSGTIRLEGPHKVTISKSVFRENVAGRDGGGVSMAGQGNVPAELLVVDTEFALNHAFGSGGAISCVELLVDKGSKLDLLRATLGNNTADGFGGAVASSCSYPNFSHSMFLGNKANAMSGGALALGQVTCTSVSEPIFVEVQLLENYALQVGGAIFYQDSLATSCAIPTVQGDRSSWNQSAGGGWNWSAFAMQVTGNKASAGELQATMPVEILVACSEVEEKSYTCRKRDGNLVVDGFPGVMVDLNVSMKDGIGQLFKDGTVTIDLTLQGGPFRLTGVKRYRFDDGYASADSAKLIVDGAYNGKVQGVAGISLQLPRAVYPNVPVVLVNVTMPDSDAACPVGWTPVVSSPTLSNPSANWKCVACPSGNYAELGVLSCSACPLGTYAGVSGSASCDICPPGYSCPAGTSLPAICFPGSARDPNDTACELCAEGTYQPANASSSCISCEDYLPGSTCQRGSVLALECYCPPNTLRLAARCGPCPDGLSCDGVSNAMQQAGYWAEVKLDARLLQLASSSAPSWASTDISVFRCRDKLECPAGPLGSCASGREGLACSSCKTQTFKTSLGYCSPCSESDLLPFCGALGVLLVGCLIFVRFFSKMNLSKQSLTLLTVTVTLGQLLAALQAVGAIRQLSVKWAEPAKSMMDMLMVLNFDFDVLHMSCLTGADSPALAFLAQLLAYPFISVSISLVCLAARFAGQRIKLDALLNVNGILLLSFNLTLTLAVLMPLQCIPNPNGTAGVSANPGVICWNSDEHWALVALALFGIMAYPVAILALATTVTLRYPGLVASGKGLEALQRYAFLFMRFRREAYFYGVLLLCRNSLVALIPVVMVEVPNLQIVSMGAVLLASAALQARLWPWKTEAANLCDLAMVLMLVVILLAAAPLLTVDEGNKEEVLGSIITAALLLMVMVPLGVVALMLIRRLRPSSRFAVFLCHHKAGAGSLARFIKSILANHSNSRIFLDSDQLEDLALIFDAVRQSSNLVVLLSPELLKRMWCAGEVTTAVENKVPIVPVICDPSYVFPNTDTLAEISSYWTDDQKATLVSFGISMDMILDAYKFLRELPSLSMNTMGTLSEKEDTVIVLLDKCHLQKRAFAIKSKDGEAARILVAGNSSDSETLSTCMTVQLMVQSELQCQVVTVRSAEEARPHLDSADFLLVLFTKGLLEDPSFARLMLAVASRGLEYVTLNADAAFQFPTFDFFNTIEREGLPGLPKELGPTLSKVYRGLMTILALPLSPMGSEGILTKQVGEVCLRFVDKKKDIRRSANKLSSAATTVDEPDFIDPVGVHPGKEIQLKIQESL